MAHSGLDHLCHRSPVQSCLLAKLPLGCCFCVCLLRVPPRPCDASVPPILAALPVRCLSLPLSLSHTHMHAHARPTAFAQLNLPKCGVRASPVTHSSSRRVRSQAWVRMKQPLSTRGNCRSHAQTLARTRALFPGVSKWVTATVLGSSSESRGVPPCHGCARGHSVLCHGRERS